MRGFGLLACALVLCLVGCHSPEFEFLPEASTPEPSAEPLAQPLRLRAHVYTGPAKARFEAVLGALEARGHQVALGTSGAMSLRSGSAFGVSTTSGAAPVASSSTDTTGATSEREAAPGLARALEYVLRVGLRIVGRPSGLRNFAVTWVFGPTFGAPGWAGMGYTYEVVTEVHLARPGASAPFLSTTLRDSYDLVYTSDEYGWLIYFWDLGCISGIVSTWDELKDASEIAPVEEAFFADAGLRQHYLRRVTAAIERAAGADPER